MKYSKRERMTGERDKKKVAREAKKGRQVNKRR